MLNLLFAVAMTVTVPVNTGLCLNQEEAQLVQLINDYRVANGKPALPTSKWLAAVGQYHAWDLVSNHPDIGQCNLHSWSAAVPPGASWQPVCYTPDHAQAAQMWAKPRQLSANVYTGNGFENAAVSGTAMTAAAAMSLWQNSSAHNDVILQNGVWATINFQGLGVGIVGGYATLWFGDGANNGGMMSSCPTENLFQSGFEQ